jgi:hypothetical protein
MLTRPCSNLPIVALMLVLAGCAGRRECCPSSGGPLAQQAQMIAGTAEKVDRGQISIAREVEKVPSPDAVDQALAREPEGLQYYALTEHQCQCLAVANAAMANAIDHESDLSGSKSGNCRTSKQRSAALQGDLLAYEAMSDRNKAAGDALELFYRLAEAEANRDLSDSSLAEIDRAIKDYEGMEGQGFRTDSDGAALRRQKTALLDRQAQLRLSIDQINGQLRSLLGCEADDRSPIWPQVDLTVTVAQVDIERAVSEGLESRPDLAALRELNGNVDSASLSGIRQSLTQIHPTLGTSPSRLPGLAQLLGTSKQQMETETRREQTSELLARQEKAASEEIRQAAQTVETRLRQIALAKQKRDNRQQHLERLKARRGADGVTAFDVSAAQMELYQAESDLVGQVVAWKIAEVKLRQAEGVLPMECGFSSPNKGCAGSAAVSGGG